MRAFCSSVKGSRNVSTYSFRYWLTLFVVDREIEIVQSLLDRIMAYDASILNVLTLCSELDCLLSFAEASRAYGYTRPTMVEDNVVDIKAGR